ncbi:hypothetical protein MES4922_620013 [Mesorhizobium ventifaucium]|uniref:Uncharacterized protein n=1 Tax=Mesorhizobium ventifaucium TaxID=666020 RepID=A0ABM9EDE9_9HYPH|nr:hypothetical protein MES4922_620013 [Mesorhizobium ventifaucium]
MRRPAIDGCPKSCSRNEGAVTRSCCQICHHGCLASPHDDFFLHSDGLFYASTPGAEERYLAWTYDMQEGEWAKKAGAGLPVGQHTLNFE